MPTIKRYTRTVIQPRATARTVDPSAISRAARPFEAVSAAADLGTQIAIKEKQAHEATQLNESVLNYRKDLLDLDDQLRRENLNTPQGYSELYSQRADELREQYEKDMHGGVKENFSMTAKELNLSQYDNALSWQRNQGAQVMGQRVENATETARTLAYRGADVDELLSKDLNATLVAASTFVGADKLEAVKSTSQKGVVMSAIEGMIDRGEYKKAQSILDSGKYDSALGADGLDKAADILAAGKKAQKAAEEQALKDSFELPIAEQMKNQQSVLDQIEAGETSSFEQIKEIKKMELYGSISDSFASDAIGYLNAAQEKESDVPVAVKAGAFESLSRGLIDLRLKFDSDAEGTRPIKINKEGLDEYKKFQSQAMSALKNKEITLAQYNKFTAPINTAIGLAIQNRKTKTQGATIMPGIQDPYGSGIKRINKYLKNLNRESNFTEKQNLFDAFAENLGRFEGDKYVVTGEYKSTGVKSKDEGVITEALRRAKMSVNAGNYDGLIDSESPPNAFVGSQLTDEELDAQIKALEEELSGG